MKNRPSTWIGLALIAGAILEYFTGLPGQWSGREYPGWALLFVILLGGVFMYADVELFFKRIASAFANGIKQFINKKTGGNGKG